LIVFGTLGFIVYVNKEKYVPFYENLLIYTRIQNSCSKPIIYYIKTFDERFGQSQTEFENNLNRSVSIWNNALGKKLFEYSKTEPDISDLSKYKLAVNLIYDERQEVTDQLKVVGSIIDSNKDTYESQKSIFDTLKSKYEIQKSSLDAMIAKYESLKASYERDITYWNSRGGLSRASEASRVEKKEYAQLEKTRVELNNMVERINTANKELNNTINELNSMVNSINSLNKDINQKIGNFNTISSSNGREFQEGEYVSDENGQRINIYQYSDYTKLIRVLTHEFGHAIGIDHVEDKDAIMYAYNIDSTIKLTEADLQALRNICEPK